MNSTFKNAIVLLLTLATTSYGSLSIQAGETGLLIWIFMGLAGMLLIYQLASGLALFADIIKGLFPDHA